jgi:hypothetical protein
MTGDPDAPDPRASSAGEGQLRPESDLTHEERPRDRDGEVRPERPVNSGRTENTADQTGIEIDHAAERPSK